MIITKNYLKTIVILGCNFMGSDVWEYATISQRGRLSIHQEKPSLIDNHFWVSDNYCDIAIVKDFGNFRDSLVKI